MKTVTNDFLTKEVISKCDKLLNQGCDKFIIYNLCIYYGPNILNIFNGKPYFMIPESVWDTLLTPIPIIGVQGKTEFLEKISNRGEGSKKITETFQTLLKHKIKTKDEVIEQLNKSSLTEEQRDKVKKFYYPLLNNGKDEHIEVAEDDNRKAHENRTDMCDADVIDVGKI